MDMGRMKEVFMQQREEDALREAIEMAEREAAFLLNRRKQTSKPARTGHKSKDDERPDSK